MVYHAKEASSAWDRGAKDKAHEHSLLKKSAKKTMDDYNAKVCAPDCRPRSSLEGLPTHLAIGHRTCFLHPRRWAQLTLLSLHVCSC